MSKDNHTAWAEAASEHQDDLFRAFKMRDGYLIVGRVENWISYCSEGGGGAISSQATKDIVGDVPAYLCAVMPGSNSSTVGSALYGGQSMSNSTGWYTVLDSITSESSALATAVLPSQMGAWWWIPLLASVAIAVVR